MQKNPSSPDSPKEDFNHSVEVPESTRIGIELHKLGDQRRVDQHKSLVERQTEARNLKLAELAEGRESLIETQMRSILDEGAKSINPALKHKDFARSDQQIKERAAYAQAVVQVRRIEYTIIVKMDTRFVRDQEKILSRAMSSHANKEFRKAASEGISQAFDRSQSKGRSL